MSSPTKDARWQLATDMLQHTQYAENLALLPYPIQEHILKSAQSILETLTTPEVNALAQRFGTPSPEVVKLDRKYVDMNRLEELQRLNQSGAPGTYIIDRVELDSILDLAMDGWDAREGTEKMGEKKILKALAGLIKEHL